MLFISKKQAKEVTGINYLGAVNKSHKHQLAFNFNEMTYGLYLAPAKMSGYEVCPMRTKECTKFCLNESGMNKGMAGEKINESRIKKTKLFFEEREFFMSWLCGEIYNASEKAKREGYKFSVRLNNTSDISPESFYMTVDKKKVNILQMFPDIQFYDYTKVPKRFELLKKYSNYDLTFSYSGENLNECHEILSNKIGRVAVVFKDTPPETFWGLPVISGDEYDMRYHDPKNVIIGLKYKSVRTRPEKNSKFVIHLN